MKKATKVSGRATKLSGGFVVKRKARVVHECRDCFRYIEPGEEYYELSLDHFHDGYVIKPICERCWPGWNQVLGFRSKS